MLVALLPIVDEERGAGRGTRGARPSAARRAVWLGGEARPASASASAEGT